MAESYDDRNVEFKKEYSDKIRRAVVAFANTNGGKLYVGIDEFGDVVGLADPEDVRRRVEKLLRDGVQPDVSPFVEYTIENAEGKRILGVEVSRGSGRPYWLADKGLEPDGALIRDGVSSAPATYEEINEMIKQTALEGFENARAARQDLSFEQAGDAFKAAGLALERRDLRTLGLVDLADAYTNLAYWLSDQNLSSIRLAAWDETGAVRERADYSGSLPRQLKDALAFIDRYNRRFVKTQAGRRVDAIEYREYPVEAIREALVNAIAHRDYRREVPTLVRLYPNRLEITSYGGLDPDLDKQDLALGVALSRNPKLADLFRRLGVADGVGRGLEKIRDAYARHAPEPVVETSRNFFKITLRKIFETTNVSPRRARPVVKGPDRIQSPTARFEFAPTSVSSASHSIETDKLDDAPTRATNAVELDSSVSITTSASNPGTLNSSLNLEKRADPKPQEDDAKN